MVIREICAIVIGYLLGSIPSAYIATRLATGRDIRRMGGGNVGGLNVYREVGAGPAAAVGIFDMGKGAAAVAIALWWLAVPPEFVLAAGLAVVVGHNWMVWLRFRGGKGMGVTIGALTVLLPVYGYWVGLPIIFGLILIPYLITRNIAVAMGLSLVALPFLTWLGMHSLTGTIFAIILGLVILVKFLPTARASWAKAESKKDEFLFDHWQRNKEE